MTVWYNTFVVQNDTKIGSISITVDYMSRVKGHDNLVYGVAQMIITVLYRISRMAHAITKLKGGSKVNNLLC